MLDDWSEVGFRSLLRSKLLWAITEPGVNFDKLMLPRNTGNSPKACPGGVTSSQLYLFSKILERRGILKREDNFHQFKIKFLSLSESSGWFEKNFLSILEVGEIRKVQLLWYPRCKNPQKFYFSPLLNIKRQSLFLVIGLQQWRRWTQP
jgi:hypothetical protein